MNLRENGRPSRMCPSLPRTSTPEIELGGVTAKREYAVSWREYTEDSSTSTASNGCCFGSSSSLPVQEVKEDTIKEAQRFCFGELENDWFLRLVNAITPPSRRMSYTQDIEMKTNNERIRAEATLDSTLSFDHEASYVVLEKIKQCRYGAIYKNSSRPGEHLYLHGEKKPIIILCNN